MIKLDKNNNYNHIIKKYLEVLQLDKFRRINRIIQINIYLERLWLDKIRTMNKIIQIRKY